ncbi:MAG: hypothetical protein ACI392_01690 [Paludibacteraceae bacterium]
MKKFYLVLCAVLFAVASFAVEYQAPVIVWEGTSSPLYGYDNHIIINQEAYDWSKVVENTRITILFKDALTELRYLYLYACASKEDYEKYASSTIDGACFAFDDVASYDLSAGDTQFQIVLSGDGVAALQLVPSLFAWVSAQTPVMTKVLVEFPVGATTNLSETYAMRVYVHDNTIVAPENAQIYSITGQNVTHLNGQLAKGVYVVRCDRQTIKMVVK